MDRLIKFSLQLFFVVILVNLFTSEAVAQQSVKIASDSNIMEYKKTADSILNEYTGVSTFKYEVLKSGEPILKGLQVNLRDFTKNAERVLRFSFLPQNGDNGLNHTVVEILYKSEKEAQAAFERISKEALEKSGTPGLTYTNDFVCRKGYAVYWINTGCVYSFENHEKLIHAFIKINKPLADGALQCKCGAVTCEKQ